MTESTLGNRYQVEARIGAGGMAEVYRGFDPILNRTVAIKVLLPQFARDTSFVQRFRREAQAAARLNQPNIVGVYDTGADDGTQYIVMEFVEGRTLGEFMETGRRPTPVQAAEIAQKICGALSAAHAVGVIHRDIKPGNVMVTREGTVKVMDFGIARVLGPETAPQTSAVLGTASYLSPEQAQGSPVDARTDIYSLGVVLYEMLAGRPPFMGDTPVAVAYKQVNETPVVPSKLNPDVPARLDAVVMKALSKNPSNRYQTADEFGADLERVIKGQDVEATPLLGGVAAGAATQVISRPQHTQVLPPAEEPEGSGRKVWLGVLIGILVVAIFGGAGYLLVSSLTGDNNGSILVTVPDLVGLDQADAESRLRDLGLTPVPRNREVDPNETDLGTVVAQDPKKNTELDRGAEVTIFIAVEPDTVLVPDLTGMTLGEASTALGAEGFTLGSRTSEPSDSIELDRIIRSEPAAGDEVAAGIRDRRGGLQRPRAGGCTRRLHRLPVDRRQHGKRCGMPAWKPRSAIRSHRSPNARTPTVSSRRSPGRGPNVDAGSVVTIFPGGG